MSLMRPQSSSVPAAWFATCLAIAAATSVWTQQLSPIATPRQAVWTGSLADSTAPAVMAAFPTAMTVDLGVSDWTIGSGSSVASPTLGSVRAWGDDSSGQAEPPTGLGDVVAVAAGGSHSLALNRDGTVVAWGANTYGQVTVPPGLNAVVAIAAGGSHSLALKADGTVVAWGNNSYGQSTIAGMTHVVAIAAGGAHNLALKADGTVTAWGRLFAELAPGVIGVVAIAAGTNQSLGLRADGTLAGLSGPAALRTLPPGLSSVVAVAAGQNYNLALQADGTVSAWGTGFPVTNVPPNLSNAVAIAAGASHGLALRADGTVEAWGDDSLGQTDVPAGLANVVSVSAGGFHSLALRASAAAPFLTTPVPDRSVVPGGTALFQAAAVGSGPMSYQWQFNGTNLQGATLPVMLLTNVQPADLGTYNVVVTNPFGVATSTPARLSFYLPFVATQPPGPIGPSSATLNGAVVPNGQPTTAWFQWGTDTSYGETTSLQDAGDGLALRRLSTPIIGLLEGGAYHCRLVASNSSGSLSYGADTQFTTGMKVSMWSAPSYNVDASAPRMPADLTNVVAVACGHGHSLAIRSDGTVAAWGGYDHRAAEVPVGLSNVVAVGGGYSHSLAVKADGTVVTWGYYWSFAKAQVPSGLSNVIAVAGGERHSMALRADGTVMVWGDTGLIDFAAGLSNIVAIASGANLYLALRADGTVVARGAVLSGSVQPPGGLEGVAAISSEVWHCSALKQDGTLATWGNYGDQSRPLAPSLSNLVAVAEAEQSSLGLRADGSLTAWGRDPYLTNIPPGLSHVVTIASGDYHSLALSASAPSLWAVPQSLSLAATANAFTITLLGRHLDGSLGVVGFRLVSLPASGQLYQFQDGGRGDIITAPGTVVTDPAGRVIFARDPIGPDLPSVTFTFVANDGQSDSPPGLVTIRMIPRPVLRVEGYSPNAGGGFSLSFSGDSSLTYAVWESTDLRTWNLLGTPVQPTPGQFQITDLSATNSATRYYKVHLP